MIAAATVLSMVPLADYLLDQSLENPSRVTEFIIEVFYRFDIVIDFWPFGVLFVGLNFINGFFKVAIRYSILRIKYAILYGLFNSSLSLFFNSKWGFFSGAKHGHLLNTLSKEMNIIGDTLGHMATQLAQLIQFVVYLSIPLFLDPLMTIIAIVLALLFSIPFLLLNRLSYRLGQKNTSTSNALLGVLHEILQAAKIILGFGNQRQSINRYLFAFKEHVEVTLKSQTLAAAVPALFAPFGILSAIVALGVSLSLGGKLSELVAVLWSLLAAFPILSSLLHTNISINNFIPSYEQLVALRRQAKISTEIIGDRQFQSLNDSIELNNLYFSYPGSDSTLSNVNIKIQSGEVTAIIGESGSGKSTIVDLVLGLQTPNKGDITIDHVEFSQWNQNSFRRKIGYVSQDTVLFYASIRDNLLWSANNATEEELWNALRLSNAESFILEMPEGIDTVVGDKGVRLSGGQRQRIALARALLRNPDLLILDEATSALDTKSELAIQDSLNKLSKKITILIVAHRLSTISNADMVYVMNQGKVAENDSFFNLSRKKHGFLYKMLELQNSNDK